MAKDFDDHGVGISQGEAEVLIDFTSISTNELADLLKGINELAAKYAIIQLTSALNHINKKPLDRTLEEKKLLRFLYSMLMSIYQKKIDRGTGIYKSLLIEKFSKKMSLKRRLKKLQYDHDFASWVDSALRKSRVEITHIREGSVIFVLSYLLVSNLLIDLPNYSMSKDFVLGMIDWLASEKEKPSPPHSLQSLPKVIREFAKHPNLKSLRFSSDGAEIELTTHPPSTES